GTSLEILGTASGRILHAQDLLTSSGGLIVEGNATFNSTITIGGVTYTFPVGDGSASGKVLATDSAGNLSWTEASGGSSELAGQGLTKNGDFLSVNATLTGSLAEFTTLSGATIRASSGLVISTDEDTAFITLHDTTNGDSVSMRTGSGNPNGVVSAQLGSLYTDHDSGKMYRNNDGATQWVELATGSGTVHMAKMSRGTTQSIDADTTTKILFDTESFDVGNIADFSTNDRFDIAKSGKYMVTAGWTVNDVLAAGQDLQVYIFVNGSNVRANMNESAETSGEVGVHITDVLELSAGDYVEMYVRQSSAGSVGTLTSIDSRPSMSVVQLDAALGGSSIWSAQGSNAEYAGTASATTLHAQDLLTISGSLIAEGAATFNSTITIGGVTYIFPSSDGSAS
ncbi:hypothetical protein COU76_04800, partial [Candidatus Peregrinibacteria bacterium CG10_big_fil_rev_8_21_14_0_10_49_10]